jgi:3-hydroxyisobutyrate dehydrogenase
MARIGFVGLGRMGAHMARNLLKAGHEVVVFDIVPAAVDAVVASGAKAAFSSAAAAQDADVVITMLPAGEQVRDAWLGQGGLARASRADALLMDCSTIDVATARDVAAAAGRPFLDAPVSGGVGGAEAGTLTFMVGGEAAALERAKPILSAMGKTIVHCGDAGAGQVAKLCNNMMLAATMAVTSEAFVMAERLGLPAQALYDVCSKSTAMSWALNMSCPVPGPVPTSAANRDFAPGFTAALMRKDLGLAQQAARDAGVDAKVGALALALFDRFVENGGANKDFSGIITMIREGKA